MRKFLLLCFYTSNQNCIFGPRKIKFMVTVFLPSRANCIKFTEEKTAFEKLYSATLCDPAYAVDGRKLVTKFLVKTYSQFDVN